MPSSSLVGVEVDVGVTVEVGVEVGDLGIKADLNSSCS